MSLDVCQAIAANLSALFSCSETPRGHVRVRTPFFYPDGGVVDVFVVERNGRITVTDFGEALGWLRLQTVAGRRSPKQNRLVQDVCVALGVEHFKGQMLARCQSEGDLAQGVLRVGQAAVRVSDLWFTTRTRSVESLTDEVADLLQDKVIPFERYVKLSGRSGRSWTVDFQTRTPERTSLVSVLTSGSRAAARRVSEHVVALWHDLSHLRVGGPQMSFVSLFDDTTDVWSDEDFRLVDDLSEVRLWSRPDAFADYLMAA